MSPTTPQEAGTAPFVLLGAGFSKAISSLMPTLAELRPRVLDRLNVDPTELIPYGNDLEQWLSFLSVDQPWLTDIENLSNRVMFMRASAAVSECIREIEQEALEAPLPNWLSRLVASWCADSATLVTFNYDVLVERALTAMGLVAEWADVYRVPLISRQLGASAGLSFGVMNPPGPTLELLKLHGSTNWGYGGLHAPSSEVMCLLRSGQGWSPETKADDSPRNKGMFDDLQPMIVPPTGTKNAFYSNAGLRAQWRNAAASLARASEVTIFGYSFPATDLATRQFFSRSLPSVPITVVDRSTRVADTVEEISTGHTSLNRFTGNNAVEDYVNANCGDLVRWGTDYISGANVPWVEVNGQKRHRRCSGEAQDAQTAAGVLAVEEIPTLELNRGDSSRDSSKTHWAPRPLAYRHKYDPRTERGSACAGDF
ncbi:hypothetical protein ACIQLM_16910 [Pseudarthrobacter oxydans]|uniref:hypothetical protein n=1 Tax=Pseudarthrobacter oxydans TaxID=1671 RepID=UPI0038290648